MSVILDNNLETPERLPAFGPLRESDQLLRALVANSLLISASNGEEALQAKLRLIMDALDMRSAYISEITPAALEVLQSADNGGCAIPTGLFPVEHTPCQYVRASGTPVVIPDMAADPRMAALPATVGLGMGSYIGVPLNRPNGTPLGTLCVVDPEPRTPTAAQVAFLQVLAHEIGLILDREQLLRQASVAATAAGNTSRATLELVDAQRQVLRVVAHDLRTPLTAIRGYSDLLLEGVVGDLSAPQQDAVEAIQHASNHLNRLVGDLMEAATVDTPVLSLVPEPYDAAGLAREVLATCTQRARSAGLSLALEAPGTPMPIFGDRARAMQVLLNLMSNALTYTRQGGVVLRVSDAGDAVRFAVIDTGPGIPAEAQTRIWQAHQRATSEGKGLGLGLHIVAQLARHMGGAVGLESSVGAGSTFWLELPAAGATPKRVAWE
ncbi:MAG: hypothetical protein OHK0022_56820 [Roseiflexaceae bacterium]